MKGIENTKKEMSILKNDERLYVYLQGNHFQQNNLLTSSNDHVINKNVVNIYIVYKLNPLASTRDKIFTIQNALFGAMQITKDATDNSKNNYKGYGICFDERSEFGHTITEGGFAHTTDARNVLIFGADMSFSVFATNRANHIYLMGTGLTHSINDTTIYAEKNFYRNFTDFGKKYMLSLHNNGDDSYLFVNGRQELKFIANTDQLIKVKLDFANYATKDDAKKTEDKVNESKKEIIFVRGFYSYEHNSDLVYDCKLNLFKTLSYGISRWKSKNIYDPSIKNMLYPVQNIKLLSTNIKNDSKGLHVFFNGGNYLHQDIIAIPNNVISIYCIYELDPIYFSRNNEFTIQNSLFGAIEITKSANTSKYKYKGYGICFDESEEFTHARKEGNFNHTTLARNVIIFGADMSFGKHGNNKANNIYVMGKDCIQKINDTTIYAEKMFYRNFTDPGHKFILRLHYNGDSSYVFVNGREELKFKTKTDQIINNQLCLGNLSFDWTKDESKKTSLYGNIYDFVVDDKAIVGATTIYDMHRYLMTKHNIKS